MSMLWLQQSAVISLKAHLFLFSSLQRSRSCFLKTPSGRRLRRNFQVNQQRREVQSSTVSLLSELWREETQQQQNVLM